MAEDAGNERPFKKEDVDESKKNDERIEGQDSEIDNMGSRIEHLEEVERVNQGLRGDLRDYKGELRREQWKILLVAIAIVAAVSGKSYWDYRKFLNEQIGKIDTRVAERLDEEFRTERIQELIENKAEKYIEEKSQEHIEKRVEAEILPFAQRFEQKISEGEAKINSIDDKTRLLDERMQLYVLLDSIRLGGSKKAYERLVRLANEESDINDLAMSYLKVLNFQFMRYTETPTYVYVPPTYSFEGKQVKLDGIPIRQIFNIIGYPHTSEERRSQLLMYLKTRTGAEAEVLAVALDVLTNSDFIYSCVAANILIAKLTGEKEGPIMDFSHWMRVGKKALNEMSP